ncbi:helix-turn-helix domain-containing protein [Rhizobium straminoryzae]|uniref:Helix-turn-helix domain-containing protein n=2 Tax=Rhizobium straminoryzae TaxID=1387186 RepID=A0A549TEQ9_9HYPH|nr:helix-turn-helix domain-containing protein [Rhizobium straminoryzae]TRL40788.1 helix-turn-helix domain-containing protein [Rhizobium straminoryzae]
MASIDVYGQFADMGQPTSDAILSPALCRAARGYLDWTQADLAEHSGVSRSTIRDFEGGRHPIHRSTEAQLRLAFERSGIAFMRADCACVGVYADK